MSHNYFHKHFGVLGPVSAVPAMGVWGIRGLRRPEPPLSSRLQARLGKRGNRVMERKDNANWDEVKSSNNGNGISRLLSP